MTSASVIKLARRAAAWLLAAALLGGCGGSAPARPNVLLVVIDTLRADHVSAYGYGWPTTPRLDALAGSGALFSNCTAQAAWTMPSMISMMTGLPIFSVIYKIPEEHEVLAERFAAAGYRTGAFVANSVLAGEAGFARGFDHFEARERMQPQWNADQLNRRALTFLEAEDEAEDDRPFFLWLHYLDPHYPYTPPRTPWERTNAEVFTDWERRLHQSAIERAPEDQRPQLRQQAAELAAEIDRYDGELHYLDDRIGQLLDRLEQLGLAESTYVIVAADHGETLFRRPETPDRTNEMSATKAERGLAMELGDYVKREHDGWVYEELVRTPLIMAGPGIGAGRHDALVSNLDIQPTVLGLAGLPVPPSDAGRDLSAALRSGGQVPDAKWATSFASHGTTAKLPGGRKLVLPGANMGRRFGTPVKLYDLVSDPDELLDIPLDAEARLIEQRLQAARDADPFKRYSGAGMDRETYERLKEMGYVK